MSVNPYRNFISIIIGINIKPDDIINNLIVPKFLPCLNLLLDYNNLLLNYNNHYWIIIIKRK